MAKTATLFLVCMAICTPLAAQNIAGSISGTVTDPSGGVIAGATATVTSVTTGARLQTVSSERGTFEFLSLAPDTYDLRIEASGFKSLVRTGYKVFAQQKLDTGPIGMEIGQLSDTVTVSGRTETVQTVSSERAGLVDREQLRSLPLMAGDPLELVATLPGFVSPDGANFTFQAPQAMREFTANGGRNSSKNYTIDGVVAMNTRGNTAASVTLNANAVEEVQVQLANYQAEYGRRSGPSINLVSRSGSRVFHGDVYFYRRHEKLNANTWDNNRNNQPKQPYRYQTRGFTIGGPIYIPGKFNAEKKKLFFFFSFSQQPSSTPDGPREHYMPTELERQGDFSQTKNTAGQVVTIKDPLTGQPFTGNKIPADRIDKNGQRLIGLFPKPTTTDPAGRFNYREPGLSRFDSSHEEMIKIDWVMTNKFTISGRWAQETNPIDWDWTTSWKGFKDRLDRPGKNLAIRTNWAVSQKSMNELAFGYNRLGNRTVSLEEGGPSYFQRDKVGYTLKQFDSTGNPLNLVPRVSFGSLPNGGTAPDFTLGYNDGLMQHFSVVENYSRVIGRHIFKAGAFVEIGFNNDLPAGGNGTMVYAQDPLNPNDAGHAYANLVLGNFNTYVEPLGLQWVKLRYRTVEGYAQDSWRVNRKLTFDYGLRVVWHQPEYESDDNMAYFDPARFNLAKKVRLYEPYRDPSLGVVARNPVTGEIQPRSYQGAIVPGSGDPNNGMVLASERAPFKDQGLVFGPRVGFAWDPRGDGKTAVRGGFGIYNERIVTNAFLGRVTANPPVLVSPTIYYGNLNNFLQATGVRFPQNVFGFSETGELPTTMNYSLGVQRRLGDLFVVDVAYVGSVSRHQADTFDYNTTPFAANFNPANENPVSPKTALPAAFLRPFIGYQGITMVEFGGRASYHSLQTQLTRRFGRRLNFNANWVWSKAMSLSFSELGQRSRLLGEWRDYGKSQWDATHVMNALWMYQLPAVSRHLGGNAVLGQILDNWVISGSTSMKSGEVWPIALAHPGLDVTGSSEGARVNIVGKVQLPASERTADRWFNPAAFALPKPGTFGVTTASLVDYGNASKDVYRGPGLVRWNFMLRKEFRFGDRARMEFGGEFYNAFNQVSYRRIDSTARFNAQGAQTNPSLGRVQGAHTPRVIQLGAKLSF